MLNRVNPTLQGSSSPLMPQAFIHSAASSVAELVSCFILTPAEVLKQNAQMIRSPKSGASSLQALRQFKKPSQLFRGYTALAARNLPFTAMQFPMYEHLKMMITRHRKEKQTHTGSLLETALVTAVSAGSAGSVAALATTPVDVVKTRIMLAAANEGSASDANKEVEEAMKKGKSAEALAKEKGTTRKSGLTVAKEVFRENGVKGLFRGGLLRAGWTALGSGLYLGAYESGRLWLGNRRD